MLLTDVGITHMMHLWHMVHKGPVRVIAFRYCA